MNKTDAKMNGTRRITALDVACILVIAAVILSVVLRVLMVRVSDSEKSDCNLAFTVSSAKSEIGDVLNEGDSVMLEDGTSLGTLSGISVTPAVFLASGSSGEVLEARYPEDTLIDISATVKARLKVKDGAFLTDDGRHICAGQTLVLHTRLADITVTVTGVEQSAVS